MRIVCRLQRQKHPSQTSTAYHHKTYQGLSETSTFFVCMSTVLVFKLLFYLSTLYSKDKASENNPNDEPTSMEEHFEFNPNVIENNNINSKNNLNNEDNNHDFVYEDFSNFSNGDSFSSIKSGQFQQRSSWLRSSIKRNG